MPEWTVQLNDVIGGWIVTSEPKPLSQNTRHNIIAECISQADAQRVADALNSVGY